MANKTVDFDGIRQAAEAQGEQTPDIQELLKLPMSQVEQLPEDQQALIWAAVAREIAGTPGAVDTMATIAALGKKAAAAYEKIKPAMQQMAEAAARTIEALKKGFTDLFLSDTAESLQAWEMLSPYIDAEADEHPELYGEDAEHPATAQELLIAAARRARADGKNIPQLKIEAAKERNKHIKEAHKRREMAQQEGAIMDVQMATIYNQGLGFFYLTGQVLQLLPEAAAGLVTDKKRGTLNLYNLTQDGQSIEDITKRFTGYHTAFLMFLLQLAMSQCDLREPNNYNTLVSLYLPAVLEQMGIDPRPRQRDKKTKQLQKRETVKTLAQMRLEKFMEFINPLRNVGAFFGGDLYQLVGFHSYKEQSEIIQITMPYLFKIAEYNKLNSTEFAVIHLVFHADIMTENQAAVEIANRIAMGVIKRGTTTPDTATYNRKNKTRVTKKKTTKTDKAGNKTVEEVTYEPIQAEADATTVIKQTEPMEPVFTWDMSFASIIDDCPLIQNEFDIIRKATGAMEDAAIKAGKGAADVAAARKEDHKNDPQKINKKLKDVFTAAIRIIMEKSEMPNYYKNLKIRTNRFDSFKAPTNSTLKDKLVITYNGKNPNFSD